MDNLVVGDTVWALNPKYRDGTRLRAGPSAEAGFHGVWVPNDTRLEVLAVDGDFARVKKPDGQEGWLRARNLSRSARVPGVTRDVVTTEMVTPDPEYVRGIKIYNLGIKEDPVPGQKFGKGLQHLISSVWLTHLSEFVGAHFAEARAFAIHAAEGAAQHPGYDFVFFTNAANHLFNRADLQGLRSQEARNLFLMATWLVMAAAEVDDFPFRKYTREQRAAQRAEFYEMYIRPRPGPGVVAVARDDAATLGAFAVPTSRRDLLPPIAMERLGINNELSALKYADPEEPLREGFLLSKRIDSLKRHFEGVHRRLTDEDHITHLLWNFHAIYHVLVLFPAMNDLVDYAAARPVRQPREAYRPVGSLDKILGGESPLLNALKLDWNEGAIAPPKSVCDALLALVRAGDGAMLRWYPQLAGGEALRAKIAEYCGVIGENLLITNGSDDALILLCQSYLGEGKVALVPVPTYEHFCVNAVGAGASLVRCELSDSFSADPDMVATAIERHRPSVVYLVSPNNPTGIMWDTHSVSGLAARFPECVFIVDEAYHEFGPLDEAHGRPPTCVALAVEAPNIVVTRTFSKAFCLASVRCGYLVAHPNTVETLRAYYNPKSVNQFAQVAALRALQEFDGYYRPYIAQTREVREVFMRDLASRGVVSRSGGAGNFVCVLVPDGRTAELCRKLEAKAIYVRDLGSRFPGYVRITIGLDMSRVTEALVEALGCSKC